jgi:hypothetical protein
VSLHEILTLLVAVIGAVTGLMSLVRTRRIAEKQLEFQAITAALAKRQLEALERQEDAQNKADVTVDLVRVGRTDFRFVLSNRGGAPATDVNFEIAKDSPDDPLVRNECERKLPYRKLEPGQSFTLIAAFDTGSAMKYATLLTWHNPDGSTTSRDADVAI